MKLSPRRRATYALALLVTGLAGAAATYRSPAATMTTAANQFLASLSDSQRQFATFPVESDERLRWNFIPNEMFPRRGITIKAMSADQRRLAHELLRSGLSQRGYLTAATIIDLENVLQVLEGTGRRFPRDPEAYYFSVFGTPSDRGPWSWRFEGHHVSLHFAVLNGSVIATSPSFFGSNPAEVRDGPRKGLRALAPEEDAGRALVQALTSQQRAVAEIAAVAPNDILTTNALDINPLSPAGIRAADLSAPQRDLLMKLIEVYTGVMSPELAQARLAKLKAAGLDDITFAWAGPIERGAKHYYRIQGPTFLVEYDNTQNDGNHIHAVWRDFKGDFGRDLLREHVRQAPH